MRRPRIWRSIRLPVIGLGLFLLVSYVRQFGDEAVPDDLGTAAAEQHGAAGSRLRVPLRTPPVVQGYDDPGSAPPTSPGDHLQRTIGSAVGMKNLYERYKQSSRYSPDTIRLTPEMTDVLNPNMFQAVSLPVVTDGRKSTATADPERAPYHKLEANQFRYIATEPVRLRLTVARLASNEVVPVGAEPGSVFTVGASGELTAVGSFTLAPDASGIHEGVFSPASLVEKGFSGYLRFVIRWHCLDAAESCSTVESEAVVHYTSGVPARFTGEMSDAVVDGSLVVETGVAVQRAGKYNITARLFAGDGVTPIAYSTAVGRLEAGAQIVRLRFYGLALREAGIPGPYVVKGLYGFLEDLSGTGRGPEMEPFAGKLVTQPYPLAGFSDHEWQSSQKDLLKKTYEDEIRRLEGLPGGAG